jgi:hypothetical protein
MGKTLEEFVVAIKHRKRNTASAEHKSDGIKGYSIVMKDALPFQLQESRLEIIRNKRVQRRTFKILYYF